jgi:uncharacterized FlaG/YvyC family protein
MSINPVQGIGTEPTRFAQTNPRSTQPQTPDPDAQEFPPPNLGTNSKQEIHTVQRASSSAELPQDEVRVLRDKETNGEIVIKYLDHSGNVILQVPSSQMLGVTRAIDQEFLDRAKVRQNQAVTRTSNAGGKT